MYSEVPGPIIDSIYLAFGPTFRAAGGCAGSSPLTDPACPLGLAGAIAGLALTREHLGFVASLGISSLGGIVTNQANRAVRACEEGD